MMAPPLSKTVHTRSPLYLPKQESMTSRWLLENHTTTVNLPNEIIVASFLPNGKPYEKGGETVEVILTADRKKINHDFNSLSLLHSYQVNHAPKAANIKFSGPVEMDSPVAIDHVTGSALEYLVIENPSEFVLTSYHSNGTPFEFGGTNVLLHP